LASSYTFFPLQEYESRLTDLTRDKSLLEQQMSVLRSSVSLSVSAMAASPVPSAYTPTSRPAAAESRLSLSATQVPDLTAGAMRLGELAASAPESDRVAPLPEPLSRGGPSPRPPPERVLPQGEAGRTQASAGSAPGSSGDLGAALARLKASIAQSKEHRAALAR
jgi:hypothetical protein